MAQLVRVLHLPGAAAYTFPGRDMCEVWRTKFSHVEWHGVYRVGWGVRPQVSRATGNWSSVFGDRVNVGEKRKTIKWFSFVVILYSVLKVFVI